MIMEMILIEKVSPYLHLLQLSIFLNVSLHAQICRLRKIYIYINIYNKYNLYILFLYNLYIIYIT